MYNSQLVMTEMTEDDVRRHTDLSHLVEVWNAMWPLPNVRNRWCRWLRGRDLIA